MAREPKPVWMIMLPGRVLFWDGLIKMDQDFWDGMVMTLMDFNGNIVRQVRSGPFDALKPYLLYKNYQYPYPPIDLGRLN